MLREKVQKTVDDYLARPEEFGVELIEGEFVMTPAPNSRHQIVSGNINEAIRAHVKAHTLGRVFYAPTDVVLSRRTVVQPDLLFVGADREKIIRDRIEGAPDLIVEILSEGTSDRDRFVKRDLYAKHGVAEYWIVDPIAKTIEVLTLKGKAYELVAVFEVGDKLSTPVLPELGLDVSRVWE